MEGIIERKGKRGDVTDIMLLMLIITFLAISFIAVLYVNGILKDTITTTDLNETDAASSIVDSFDTVNTVTVQRAFAFAVGILMIGTLVSAFLVRMHPAFIFLYIIILAFTIFVSVYTGNLYSTIAEVDEFSSIAAENEMITFFMENIVKIVLALGALSMIIVFGKIFGKPGGMSPDADI